MAAPGSFALLIEGSWDRDPPENLSTKLQVYFQSQKRSGGGECEVRHEFGNPGRFLVFFAQEDAQQRVLQREDHVLIWPRRGTFKLTVKLPTALEKVPIFQEKVPIRESKTKVHAEEPEELDKKPSLNRKSEEMEDTQAECESIPSLIAFENLQETVTELMLILLVEEISGLSRNDFQVEVIRDCDVAVVTFQNYIDVMKFFADCSKSVTMKHFQISPRLLEVTKTIRVENLPPNVDDDDLKCLFENSGNGKVASVQYFPEESSALIEFFDRKVANTIMTKKLQLNNMPLSVFRYYPSLGTALYGREKPLIKLPAPFRESLELPLWKFLQKNHHLVEKINAEMRRCHCELTWSQPSGEVTIRPAASLLNQGRQGIKNWREKAFTTFAAIRSKYKVSLFKVEPTVWDAIKSELAYNRVLIEFDTLKGIITLVGRSEDVLKIKPRLTKLIESTTKRVIREKQSLREKVSVSPGKFSLLFHSGALERFLAENPEMEILYEAKSQQLCIKGLPAEVHKVKCEFLGKVRPMAQKHVQLPPKVFHFLQQVDAVEFSKSLFIAQKILAVYELESQSVLLTGCSSEDLVEAEKQMNSALSYQRIDVENREVLNGKKWKGLIRPLLNKHNSSSKTVIIEELTSHVIVAGCVREVKAIYDSLSDFLGKHMIIERMIEVKPLLVNDFLRKEKKLLWNEIKKTNLQVVFNPENKGKGILLIGLKTDVLKGMKLIKQAQGSLCVKSICVDQPGARELFQEKAPFYRSEAKRLFGCFIELQENEEKGGGGSAGQKGLCQVDLAPGVSLIVQQGDLAGFPVEVVVNPANEELKHIGGLAAALLKAAGPELQDDCDQIVKRNGKIPPGQAIISKAGKLPYRHVIHAVGPHWKKKEAQRCVSQLNSAVTESLHLAEKHKCQSIAIPAISSGVFGFPLPQCAETIVLAIKAHFQHKSGGCTLKEIYLVDIAEKTIEAFAAAVRTQFKDSQPASVALLHAPAACQPVLRKKDGNGQVLLTPEGLRVLLVKGDVQSASTDVIVNSIPSDLALDRGPLSRALLGKAGPKLQEELNRAGQAVTVNVGTVLLTSGCNLQCQHVLHVVPPDWRNDSVSAHKIMKALIRECLDITQSLSLKSIAFPTIGTGNLGFPKSVFAKLIFTEVLEFSSKNQATILREVHFLLHPQDQENIKMSWSTEGEQFAVAGWQDSGSQSRSTCSYTCSFPAHLQFCGPQTLTLLSSYGSQVAFSEEFIYRSNGNSTSDKIPQAEDTQGLFGTVSNPIPGVHEMKIGPIIFQVATGDITKEEADVIVNSTSNTFNLKTGVSKAILESAGQNVEVDCFLQAQQGNGDYIITEGGLLKCKNIIHVVGANDVRISVNSVLQESEKRNYSSICLPAIGTGGAKQNPDTVAGAIIDAIEGFVQKGSVQSVKKVKVVLFVPQLLDVFYTNMKKREGTQSSLQQSVLSNRSSLWNPFFLSILLLLDLFLFVLIFSGSSKEHNPSILEKKTEPAIFQVCGENVKGVENALSWIQNLIEKEQCSYTTEDESIKHFNEKETQKLNELQKKLNITIFLDYKRPLIKVLGISRDVIAARNEIEKVIGRVRLAKEQESWADYTSEFIEWQYSYNNTFHSFDKITILQLEDARRMKKITTNVKINHQTYTVNLKTFTATNAMGHSLPVQRIKKPEVENPEHWTDMKQQDLLVVDLQPGHPEYNIVARKFNETCANFRIEKIERIQNPVLWNSYQTKKKTMDAKNNHVINEKQLFHGTDVDSVPHVNCNGFNRSYAGKNAAAYGKGTYFAVNAIYSASDIYSKPDRNGKKRMYYGRVLTGHSAAGCQSLIVPPAKDPRNPTDLYDTATDCVTNPSLFVVFYDYQAYPEYLITFRK